MTFVLLYLAGYLSFWLAMDALARRGLKACRRLPPGRGAPGITLIKPVRGADAFTEENFRSWLEQDYPGPLQVIFSLQEARDPALAALKRLRGVKPFETVVKPVRPGYSGKMSNLTNALELARHEVLVFSDADIRAKPDALRRIVGVLEDGGDLVSSPVRHAGAKGLWARVYAEAWNAIILWAWLPAMTLGRAPGAAGGTLALKRGLLERLGGLEAFRNYLQEDVALGAAARAAGARLALGPVVDCPVGRFSFRELYDKLARVSFLHIHKAPAGALGGLLLPLALYGYWVLLAASLALGKPSWLAALAAFALARAALSGRLESLATGRFRLSFDFIAGDWAALAAFLAALTVPEVSWGGIRYRVKEEGRVVRVG